MHALACYGDCITSADQVQLALLTCMLDEQV